MSKKVSLVGAGNFSNTLVKHAEKVIQKSTPNLCFNKSNYVSIYSSDTLKCYQTILFLRESSMLNRKMILAGKFCLHGERKRKFPILCHCTKTDISSLFWKLQAWHHEHRLLIPCGSHRKCIQGANSQYTLIHSIASAWSLSKKNPTGFSLDFLLPYLLCYIHLQYSYIFTNCKVSSFQWYHWYACFRTWATGS